MSAIFCDLDGTVFYWGTETPLPRAIENIQRWIDQGHQIIFTTQRDEEWAGKAVQLFQSLGIEAPVLHDIQNPRIVVNDAGAYAINHPRNEPWPQYEIPG